MQNKYSIQKTYFISFLPSFLSFGIFLFYLFPLSFLAAILVMFIQKIIFQKRLLYKFRDICFAILLAVNIFLAAFQVGGIVLNDFPTFIKPCLGKSLAQKKIYLHKFRYFYAEIAKQLLVKHGCIHAQLITDYDISSGRGMTVQRSLHYLLYPVKIRGVRKGMADSKLVFNKEKALEHVGEDFEVLIIFNDRNLIAIKKNKQ